MIETLDCLSYLQKSGQLVRKQMNHQKAILIITLTAIAAFSHAGCNTQPVIVDEKPKIEQAKVGKIIFGENYEKAETGKGFRVIGQKASFTPDDSWAYSVMCEEPFGKIEIRHVLSFIDDKRGEQVVAKETIDISDPGKHRYAAGGYESCKAYFGESYGRYKLRYFRDDTLLAEGEFTYQKN